MKLIGLSGAQGAGKSTLLKALTERGWLLDSFRVSRAVQAQLGWDKLEKVMESPQTMIKFQEAVFEQKRLNDFKLHQILPATTREPKGQIMLCERTFADISAYTTQWTWRFVDSGAMTEKEGFDFITPFNRKCMLAQEECYSGTLMLPYMEHVAWEDDPNRASHSDVEAIYQHIRRYMELPAFLSHPKLEITAKTVQDRIKQTEQFLESI